MKLGILLFFGLLCVLIYLIYTKITKKSTKSTQKSQTQPTPITLKKQNQPCIRVGIHAYRCNPHPIAQTIFGLFEAASDPSRIHVYIYQELQVSDTKIDGFELYRKSYYPSHSSPSPMFLDQIHVRNRNANQSSGPLIGFLTIARDMAQSAQSRDICMFIRPFYNSNQTSELFGLSFVQKYDEYMFSSNSYIQDNRIFTTKLPQTRLQQENHQIQETNSLAGSILNSVALPFIKSKMSNLDQINSNVTSLKTWKTLQQFQSGITAWTSQDKDHSVSSKNTNIIYSTFLYFKDLQTTPRFESILPVNALYEDIQVMNSSILMKILQKAERNLHMVKSIPYYAYSLVLSDLCYLPQIGFDSLNHVPIACIMDHIQGNSTTKCLTTIQAMDTFRPLYWKKIPRIRVNRKTKKKQTDMVPCSDMNKLLPLQPSFQQYACNIQTTNLSGDAFLGKTNKDSQEALTIKYGSLQNLTRLQRVLGLT